MTAMNTLSTVALAEAVAGQLNASHIGALGGPGVRAQVVGVWPAGHGHGAVMHIEVSWQGPFGERFAEVRELRIMDELVPEPPLTGLDRPEKELMKDKPEGKLTNDEMIKLFLGGGSAVFQEELTNRIPGWTAADSERARAQFDLQPPSPPADHDADDESAAETSDFDERYEAELMDASSGIRVAPDVAPAVNPPVQIPNFKVGELEIDLRVERAMLNYNGGAKGKGTLSGTLEMFRISTDPVIPCARFWPSSLTLTGLLEAAGHDHPITVYGPGWNQLMAKSVLRVYRQEDDGSILIFGGPS